MMMSLVRFPGHGSMPTVPCPLAANAHAHKRKKGQQDATGVLDDVGMADKSHNSR